ncbi:MAG: SurA N-terminal domain-containing protein [Parvularculaceae bacterium]|nr:SurA N-terminal domain-containing protein [Parvularculaceae bacterium]
MLKQVRSGMKNIIAIFGAVLLVLSFALWGVPGLSNFAQRPTLKVGSEALSTSMLQSEYSRAMRMKREEREGKYTPDDARAEGLGEQVLQQVTTRSILEQEARKLGLVMTDDMVKEYIETNENFKNPTTGKFDPQRLAQILQANELNQTSFETLIRNQLLRDQLISSLMSGPPAPESFARTLLLRESEARRVGYLTVTADMSGPAKEPAAEDLRKYYEANLKDFTAPEYRTFNAVILRPADFVKDAPPAEEDLIKIYEANKARLYETPEKRTLYQTTFGDEAKARAAADALRQGKPFEAVAVENGSTLAASTLTEISRKDMLDPAVADAAFAEGLTEGAIVGPVKGLFGHAVIQIAGVIAPTVKSFEEVRPEILADFEKQAGRKKVRDAVEALQAERDTGAVLVDAAKKAGVAARQFGPVDSFSFAPGGAIVADLPGEVLKEAFALAEGDESEPQLLSDGGYFLVHVESVRPPAAMPYDQVADEVAQKWRAQEQRGRVAAAVKKVTEATAAGAKLADAAAGLGPVLETTLRRGRPDPFISPDLSEKAFAAPLNAVVVGESPGGGQTLVEVREIDFGRNPLGPGQEAGFREILGSQLNQEYLEAYLNGLREDYAVKVDRERLAAIFNEQPQ